MSIHRIDYASSRRLALLVQNLNTYHVLLEIDIPERVLDYGILRSFDLSSPCMGDQPFFLTCSAKRSSSESFPMMVTIAFCSPREVGDGTALDRVIPRRVPYVIPPRVYQCALALMVSVKWREGHMTLELMRGVSGAFFPFSFVDLGSDSTECVLF